MPLNNPSTGGGYVPEYQVAPAPFVTQSSVPPGGVAGFTWGTVARSLVFTNHDSGSLDIGFSLNGVNASNKLRVATSGTLTLDCRFTSFFVKGVIGQQFSLFVGLTGIDQKHIAAVTGSNGYPVG